MWAFEGPKLTLNDLPPTGLSCAFTAEEDSRTLYSWVLPDSQTTRLMLSSSAACLARDLELCLTDICISFSLLLLFMEMTPWAFPLQDQLGGDQPLGHQSRHSSSPHVFQESLGTDISFLALQLYISFAPLALLHSCPA